MREQQNNKLNTIRLTIGSETKPLSYWSEEYKISYNTIKSRLRLGWPVNIDLFVQPSFVPYNRKTKSNYAFGLIKKDIDYCKKKIDTYNKEINFLKNRLKESETKFKDYKLNGY